MIFSVIVNFTLLLIQMSPLLFPGGEREGALIGLMLQHNLCALENETGTFSVCTWSILSWGKSYFIPTMNYNTLP